MTKKRVLLVGLEHLSYHDSLLRFDWRLMAKMGVILLVELGIPTLQPFGFDKRSMKSLDDLLLSVHSPSASLRNSAFVPVLDSLPHHWLQYSKPEYNMAEA
jgi:hypothetical protein